MRRSRPLLSTLIALMLVVYGVGGVFSIAPLTAYADDNVIPAKNDDEVMENVISEEENNEPTGELISEDNEIEEEVGTTTEDINDESVREVIDSGECGQDGDSVQWTKENVDGNIVLTISGQGKIKDYAEIYKYENSIGWSVGGQPWGTDINKVVVEKGITRIGNGSFYNCSKLKDVDISDGLLEIGDLAFQECSSLESISIPADVNYLGMRGTGGSISSGIHSGGNQIKLYYGGTIDEFLQISNNGFSLGDLYIDSKIITTISLPENTTKINDYAFYGLTSLKSINIPEGVLTIGDNAFGSCKRLTGVSIPDTVTSIGEYSFYLCNTLSSVKLPKSLNRIEKGAFEYCVKLVDIEIPESVSYVGESAFERCPAVLSFSGEISLQQYSFHLTRIKYIKIADGTTVLPRWSFSGWNYGSGYGYLQRIDLPESLEIIDESAFIKSNLGTKGEHLYLPKQLKTINKSAFDVSSCSYDKIVIPDSVEYIGDGAFNSKTIIELRCPPPTVLTTGLKNCKTIYYSCSLWDETDRYNWSPDANWIPVHTYSDWEITKESTCTEEGKKEKQCASCGDIVTESVPIINHSYGSWRITAQPTYSANGSKEHICAICGYVEAVDIPALEKVAISKTSISGIAAKTYTGKALTQAPTIKYGSKTLKAGTDYTLTYKNNKNVGTATVTITGKGGYTGSVNKTFQINPKGATIAKPVAAKKAITIKWKKQSAKMATSTITGYQIRYSTSSKMTSAKTKTVKGYKYTSKKITKLKAKKKYYVQVRTYKTVSGKNYYSSWSSIKSVKTK